MEINRAIPVVILACKVDLTTGSCEPDNGRFTPAKLCNNRRPAMSEKRRKNAIGAPRWMVFSSA